MVWHSTSIELVSHIWVACLVIIHSHTHTHVHTSISVHTHTPIIKTKWLLLLLVHLIGLKVSSHSHVHTACNTSSHHITLIELLLLHSSKLIRVISHIWLEALWESISIHLHTRHNSSRHITVSHKGWRVISIIGLQTHQAHVHWRVIAETTSLIV